MRKLIQKSLSILIILTIMLCSLSVGMIVQAADYFQYGDASSGGRLQYMILSASTVSVKSLPSGGMPSNGYINIPASVNGYTVVGIANSAFANKNIKGVNIPGTVTYIDELAFYGCDYLTSVFIPASITTIGSQAFSASGLQSVSVPHSVTSLGKSAFSHCTGLTSATIGDGVTSLSETFNYCSNLSSVTLGENIKTIGSYTFGNCTSLTSIKIPFSVTTINYAFYNCSSLKSIYIPHTVTSISGKSFYNTTKLTDVYYSGNMTQWDAISIEDGPYVNDNELLLEAYIHYNSYSHRDHSYNTVVNIKETCTSSGSYTHTCTKCGYSYKETKSALGHNYTPWQIVTAATCTENGSQKRSCTRSGCTYTETAVITSPGHDWQTEYTVDIPATCTADGSESIHCSRCNYTKDSRVIPYTGHDLSEWGTVFEPTCSNNGEERRSCSKCDYYESNPIPKLDHDWSDEYTIDSNPTCTEEGSKSLHCSRCDETSSQTAIPFLGHYWENEYTVDKEPTCTEEGSKSIHCSRCDEKSDITVIPVLEHDWEDEYTTDKESTCTEDGSKSIHCSDCDARDNVTVIPAAHKPDNWQVSEEPDCTKVGEKVKICTVCTEVVEREAIAMLDHIHGDWEITLEPTTASEGFKVKRCVNCDTVVAESSIPKYETALSIKKPSVSSVNYGDTLVLSAEATNLPPDAHIKWTCEGNGVTISVSEDTFECRITSVGTGKVTVTATVVDEYDEPMTDDNAQEFTDVINISSNGGFFQKLISFFKNLFGMNRIIY